MAGFVVSANAQNMCSTTGGVESTKISKARSGKCSEIMVTLANTNDYKVTVNMKVTVVDVDGNETLREKTVVIPAKKENKEVIFRTKKVKGEDKCADVGQCFVSSLFVQKCD